MQLPGMCIALSHSSLIDHFPLPNVIGFDILFMILTFESINKRSSPRYFIVSDTKGATSPLNHNGCYSKLNFSAII